MPLGISRADALQITINPATAPVPQILDALPGRLYDLNEFRPNPNNPDHTGLTAAWDPGLYIVLSSFIRVTFRFRSSVSNLQSPSPIDHSNSKRKMRNP